MKSKNILKLLAIVLAAGFPCAAFAELLGARVSGPFTAESTIGLYSAALLALLMIGDYSRRTRSLASFALRNRSTPVGSPTAGRETHRLAI